MAQGFKPAKAASTQQQQKRKQTSSVAKKAIQPKKGARIVPPKKAPAIATATKKRQQNASVTGHMEQEMIGRAASGGPLKMLKATKAKEEQAKTKEVKGSKTKVEGKK